MKSRTIAPPLRLFALGALALAMFGPAAHAQLMIDLKLSKKTYVEHEPILATVSVKNLAGHDLILSNRGGGGWLNFDLRRGNSGISQRQDAPKLKPRALKAGSTFTETVNLGRYYPLGLPSDYAVSASVYYPPLKKYFSSPRRLIRVNRAKTLWKNTVGIPQGNNRPIQFRKYSLLEFRDGKRSDLYVRVSSEDDTVVYSTRSIGGVLRSFAPNIDVDSANRLHVLHLRAPQIYAHTVIDTDGMLLRQDYYKDSQGSRPKLKNLGGSLHVRGGFKTSRTGVASTVPQGVPRDTNPNRIRKASERPAGLPIR